MSDLIFILYNLDGSWNTSDPVTINVGSAAVLVSKMLPVGDKLWCSCHNTVKIFDTISLQFQVCGKHFQAIKLITIVFIQYGI